MYESGGTISPPAPAAACEGRSPLRRTLHTPPIETRSDKTPCLRVLLAGLSLSVRGTKTAVGVEKLNDVFAAFVFRGQSSRTC